MTVTVAADSTTSTADATSSNALTSISSNYNEFLTLLTTQLQNQDPSNPTDTSQFTSELAQFAGVEQQVSTNTNLTSLIQLAQSQQVLDGSSLLGQPVQLSSSTLPLQNGAAALNFTATAAAPVQIVVSDASGTTVDTATVKASAGSNAWSWNGQTSDGAQEPDGAYTVAVTSTGPDGTSSALSFTTSGTVTGVSKDGSGIDLALGASTVSLNDVTKVGS